MADYDSVRSVPAEEFERGAPSKTVLNDEGRFTRSEDEDIAKMERLLDLREGTLAREVEYFYLERVVCVCGRVLTVYDLVFSGLVDAGHSRSLVVHTMLGNKLVRNSPRPVRCSNCSRMNRAAAYHMPAYDCDVQEPKSESLGD